MEQLHRFPFGLEPRVEPLRAIFDETLRVDLSAPRKMEVGIPMRDGIELAADVHLPGATSLPAPAIVTGTPYNKDDAVEQDVQRPVEAGYVVVRYDSRGRGKSEGDWHPFTMQDAYDGHDAVEWIAQQEWCTGAVGVKGLSYDGWIVMATISQSPPHLRAAIPISPAGRWQQEIPYTHGCLQIFFAWWWAFVRRRINDSLDNVPELLQILPVEAMADVIKPVGPGWQEMMDHDTLDEVWRSRRWDGEYHFDVPCLHVTGWHDREDIHAAFHHYEQMMQTSPARDDQWLLVGPWPHVSCAWPSDEYKGIEFPGGSLDMTAIQLKFFDRFLRDERNGFDDEPRVQIYDPGDHGWKVRPSWKGDTRDHEIFLGPNLTLRDDAGADGADSYRYDPMHANGLTYDLDVLPLEPPLDLRELEEQPGVLNWTTEPLDEDLTVRGWGELVLWAATDGEDTEWHVKVSDVDPDGRSLWVSWGCLRASYGQDFTAPAPLTPGEPQVYSIELTPTFHTFMAGQRLRLILASSEFPWFARNLNQFGPLAKQKDPRVATNTVFHGQARPSRLRLQVEG
jgi:putative CocE/NonD family hydrolase